MHRFQISTFGAVAIVFAVLSVNESIFSGRASLDAMAAGWLILSFVDILWVLYFTSEEDSLALHLFNSLGTGGLSPPSRRRRTRGPSVHNMASNGYAANYSSGAGIGSQDIPYDPAAKIPAVGPAAVMSQNSFVGGGSVDGVPPRALAPAPTGSTHSTPIPAPASPDPNIATGSPLIGPGAAGLGAGNTLSSSPSPDAVQDQDAYIYKAKALYACP
jgi:SHO1 osmosensor